MIIKYKTLSPEVQFFCEALDYKNDKTIVRRYTVYLLCVYTIHIIYQLQDI